MEEVARTVDRLVVVNDGTIPLEGTPAQVFRQDSQLRAMGLDVPQVTQVFRILREKGYDLPWVYTVEEAAAALLKRGGDAEC
jgi:energy-coupling factor transport system ATP-binding protein